MSLVSKIALRYLKSKKTHSAVNIISIISVCGVLLATAALVCVLSVFNGFAGLMGDRLAKLDPQIKISAAQGKTIANADSVIRAVSAIQGVALAVPTVEDHALAVFGTYQMPIRIKGIPADYDSISDIKSVIVDGEYILNDQVSQYSILSIGAAMQLHARAGFIQMLTFYAPQRVGTVNMMNPAGAFRTDSTFVGAVYQVEQNSYDRDMVYVPIDMARYLFDYDQEATAIELRLMPGADESDMRKSISAALGDEYVVQDRLMQQSTAFHLVNIEKWVTFLLLGFILIIATFNVISTLSLLIIEKDESIQTFRSLGAPDKMITRIFVTEGWMISLFGAVIGIAVGVVLVLLQQYFGLIQISGSSEVLIVRAYPVELKITDLLVVFALVAVIGFITSLVTSLLMRSRLRK